MSASQVQKFVTHLSPVLTVTRDLFQMDIAISHGNLRPRSLESNSCPTTVSSFFWIHRTTRLQRPLQRSGETSQRRIASYILCGVFLRQRIVFNSYTSSFSLGPCFELFVMICPMQCSAEAICDSLAALNAVSAGTGPSRKMNLLQHYSFLCHIHIQLHRRTQSRNE